MLWQESVFGKKHSHQGQEAKENKKAAESQNPQGQTYH
jgi:hypothetical protein